MHVFFRSLQAHCRLNIVIRKQLPTKQNNYKTQREKINVACVFSNLAQNKQGDFYRTIKMVEK